MKKQPVQSVTALPRSFEEEQHSRVIKYSIAMGIRMLCFSLVFFVQGWWLLVAIVGALVLPYIAVVLANTASPGSGAPVLRPGGLVRVTPSPEPTPSPDAGRQTGEDAA